jgi:hypothetical protein
MGMWIYIRCQRAWGTPGFTGGACPHGEVDRAPEMHNVRVGIFIFLRFYRTENTLIPVMFKYRAIHINYHAQGPKEVPSLVRRRRRTGLVHRSNKGLEGLHGHDAGLRQFDDLL